MKVKRLEILDPFYQNCRNAKGPFKYYIIKEVGGRGGQMMMFDDKVGVGGVAK